MQNVSSVTFERHARRRIGAQLVGLAVLAALVIPMGTFAARGGGTSVTPWIALGSVGDSSALAASDPHLGSSVRFATGYPGNTRNPWVSLTCYQDSTLVYGEGGSPKNEFSLGGASSVWLANGGAATCKAELGDLYWRGGQQYYTYMAETWFDASA